MYLTHAQPPSTDVLHIYLGITDATSNPASDMVILMLDTEHTHSNTADDKGLCFRRNYAVEKIETNPTGPCVAHAFSGLDAATLSACPAGGRGCISSSAGQWSVEVNLVPADFGLTSFGGTVGLVVRAVDGNGATSTNIGPNSPVLTDPATWANLTLGYAVDIVLVLDLSGSMGALACPSSCPTKLDFLKQAVDRFVADFSVFAWQADRTSVIYFKTNVSEFPTPGSLVNLLANATAIRNSVQGASASNATALGGGLQTAINLLSTLSTNPGRKRQIVLFSDGMQNVNPMVVDDGTGNFHIDNVPGRPASGVPVSSPPTLLEGSVYKVHTLGIDATEPFITLMLNIANETGGTAQNNPDASTTWQMFVNTLVSSLSSHGSPQLLAFRRNTLSSDAARETFIVNRGVRKILLQTSWPGGKRLSFQVFKDGKNVTSAGHTQAGNFYQMFYVDLPARAGPDEITAEGQWELQIQGQPGTTYEVAALVDEPALKYEVSGGSAGYVVGESLQLTAEITYGGAPVDDAVVTALVGKPGEGIGTLLSVNPTPSTTPAVQPEPQSSPAQAKLQRLLEDEKLWRRIQPVNRTVELKSVGGGKYTGAFSGTDVTGPYPVTFLIAGENASIGKYRRTQTLSTAVRFGSAEFEASEVAIQTITQTPEGRRTILHIRPRDRFGNFLGPDFADRIDVSLTEGTVVGKPRDLLDGRYEIVLLLPAQRDPEITITVVDHRLFKGAVSKLRSRRFAASLHAGVSLPHGSFDNTHDPGFGITADAEYWWNRRFAVAALLGYHRFGGEAANPDLDLFHASAALEARVTSGSPSVIVDAGGGLYKFSPGSTDPGIHAGVGAELNVSPTVSLGVAGRAHTVFTTGSNTTFSSLQAGGRIRF